MLNANRRSLTMYYFCASIIFFIISLSLTSYANAGILSGVIRILSRGAKSTVKVVEKVKIKNKTAYLPDIADVYMEYKRNSTEHGKEPQKYTISEEEKDIVINKLPEWEYEGTAWYLKTDHSLTNAVTKETFSVSTPTPLLPISDFAAAPASGSSSLTVNFKDNSEGNITDWEWNFGDNTTSTEKNPIHTFNSDGNYSITHTGADDWQTLEKKEYIGVKFPNLQDAVKALQVLPGDNPFIETEEN